MSVVGGVGGWESGQRLTLTRTKDSQAFWQLPGNCNFVYRGPCARLASHADLAMWNEIMTSPGVVSAPLGGAQGGARPTFAEIDLDAIARNLHRVTKAAGAAKVYAVVKADAYGHGLVQVARRLQSEGVAGICVALAEEGLRLRQVQIDVPILVLNGAYGDSHVEVLRAGLTPVIFDLDQARAFAAAAGAAGQVDVHLKVDTGMARLGVPYDDLGGFLSELHGMKTIRIVGLMTHLSSADTSQTCTARQCERFAAALATVRAAGHCPEVLHVQNSAGVYRRAPGDYDIARVGLSLYGAGDAESLAAGLQPAMRVRSEVLALRTVQAGCPVGYDGTFVTERPTRLATVPIGYGDGFLRAGSNRGQMLVGGQRCPIVGTISMDLTSLDVTDVPDVAIGDEVVVLGSQGDAVLTAADVATAAGTIAYEVLCNLSARVPRVYRGAL